MPGSTELDDPLEFLHACRLCPLHAGRTRVVRPDRPGAARTPKVVLVGEAPGEAEDRTGRPFVGKAGELLRATLRAVGLAPEELWITNAVKCRPPGNRPPTARELAVCRDNWLLHEIASFQPDLVVCLGASAARALFGSGSHARYAEETTTERALKGGRVKRTTRRRELTLAELRARDDLTMEYTGAYSPTPAGAPDDGPGVPGREVPVLVCYHPSAALRMARTMGPFVADMRRLAERLRVGTTGDQPHDYAELEGPADRFSPDLPIGAVAIDTEFEPHTGELLCFSFSTFPGWARVVFADGPERRAWARKILAHLVDGARRLVFHNAPADVLVIRRFLGFAVGEFPWERVEDTMLQAYLLNRPALGLKSLAQTELGLDVIRIEELLAGGRVLSDVPRSELVVYSAQDADLTLRLWRKFTEELSGDTPAVP